MRGRIAFGGAARKAAAAGLLAGGAALMAGLGGFWRKAASPAPPAAGPSPRVSARGRVEWITIPGGRFMMGYGAHDGWADTKLEHLVALKSFEMAKTPVTNKQYRACVAAGACAPAHWTDGTCVVYDGSGWRKGNLPGSFQGDDQPVVCVDWEQAKAFSAWVGGRLPSEAEWEYAAKSAGRDWNYPWGDADATCARAVVEEGGRGCGRDSTWPVCSKPEGNTAQGLCDMAGNVWEWVEDGYRYAHRKAPVDGSAWEGSVGSNRVLRGGSWYRAADVARSANSNDYGPRERSVGTGFRPAR